MKKWTKTSLNNMSQTDRIAQILRREGKIDNFYAIHNRISLRLGARIWDLRQQGWVIEAKEGENKNCTYTLISEPTTPPKVLEQFRREIISNQLSLKI